EDIQAVLIAPSEDMKLLFGDSPYLCERFQGIFITNKGDYFVICNLLSVDEYIKIVGDNVKIFSWSDNDGFINAVINACKEYDLINARIGVNNTVRAFNIASLCLHMRWDIVDAVDILHEIRIKKTEIERQALRDSSRIADQVFEKILQDIKPGITELDIKDRFSQLFKEAGATNSYSLVASGKKSALPHYSGTEKELKYGEAIILDFGCVYNGMCSDITRTIFIGKTSDEQRQIYNIVKKANQAAEDIVNPGTFIPDIDKIARDIISNAGYADYFPTRLGHGIGYSIHEAPDIKQSNIRCLEPGMAFSIEPGIYLPSKFGVRIEDIVLVTEKGKEVLNKATKKLLIV
ncbi:MAG: M24 family metallopeptidase, partial [Saccharofermentanales bacterium]